MTIQGRIKNMKKLTTNQQIKNIAEVMEATLKLSEEKVLRYYRVSKVEKIKEYIEMLLKLIGA